MGYELCRLWSTGASAAPCLSPELLWVMLQSCSLIHEWRPRVLFEFLNPICTGEVPRMIIDSGALIIRQVMAKSVTSCIALRYDNTASSLCSYINQLYFALFRTRVLPI